MPAIYFLSDYGTADEFVGVVHAVLHRHAPRVPVIDLGHHVPPFDIAAGAGMLVRSAPHLGPGVVLAVVDPGVGTGRRGVAIEVAGGRTARRGPEVAETPDAPRWLVGPDNGLLVPAAEVLGGVTAVYALAGGPGVRTAHGPTFDGRDVFAPVAAHLASGGAPGEVGPPVDGATLVPAAPVPADRIEEGRTLVTVVTVVDAFGNVQLRAGAAAAGAAGIRLGSRAAVGIGGVGIGGAGPTLPPVARHVRAYADLQPGELGLLVDATGHLALVLDRDSAAERLGTVAPGTEVRLGAPA